MGRLGPGKASIGLGRKVKATRVYKQLQQVRKLLLPDIQLVITPSWLDEAREMEYIDVAGNAADAQIQKLAHTTSADPMPPYIFTTAFKVLSFAADRELMLQHDVSKAAHKKAVKTAFAQVFGKKFTWDGSMRKAMKISA